MQSQQPCIHCGDCARTCPAGLDPQSLFFSLVAEDWPAVQRGHLDACTECHRCVEVCPSHIPLLVWLRWGKTELRRQVLLRERAAAARARYETRNARLQRERELRESARIDAEDTAPVATEQIAATPISKAEVMEAIARSRARREALARARRTSTPRHDDKDGS